MKKTISFNVIFNSFDLRLVLNSFNELLFDLERKFKQNHIRFRQSKNYKIDWKNNLIIGKFYIDIISNPNDGNLDTVTRFLIDELKIVFNNLHQERSIIKDISYVCGRNEKYTVIYFENNTRVIHLKSSNEIVSGKIVNSNSTININLNDCWTLVSKKFINNNTLFSFKDDNRNKHQVIEEKN